MISCLLDGATANAVAAVRCDEREHIEGWLSGRGHGRLDRYQLRAAVVARAELPDGLVANTLISRITGAVVRSG